MKLCQPIGIRIELGDRNIYVEDSGSGAIKLINKSLEAIAAFFGKLITNPGQGFFNIHSKESTVQEPKKSVGEIIMMMDEVLEYVRTCSKKAREYIYYSL